VMARAEAVAAGMKGVLPITATEAELDAK